RIVQAAPGLGSVVCDATLVPFITQICGVPACGSGAPAWSRISDVPSPVKSFFAAGKIEIVVVTTVLRLFEPEPSLSVQVRVRVGFAPELVGLAPDENTTLSSTCW